MLKKSICFILVIALIMSSNLIVLSASVTEGAVWIEAEKYTSYSGNYVRKSGTASGNYMLVVDTTRGTQHTLGYEFTTVSENDYDIWVLSTDGLADYASKFKWSLDNNAPVSATKALIHGGTTADTKAVPMYWHKLTTQKLSKGKHTLSIIVDEIRAMGDNFYHVVDCFAVVPKNWAFEPNGFEQPVNPTAFKLNYVSGSISTQNPQPKTDVTVTAVHSPSVKPVGNIKVFARLMFNGQIVAEHIKGTSADMTTWRAGQNYTDNFTLSLPFNMPDGNYEIVVGFNGCKYSDGAEHKTVAEFCVGKEKNTSAPLSIEIDGLSVASIQTKGKAYNIKTSVKINRTVDFDTTGYLTFWKNDILWGVVELGEVRTSQFAENSTNSLSFNYKLDQDIPNGTYDVKFGLHQFGALQVTSVTVEVNGAAINRSRTYKPLGNGIFNEKYSGKCHFWYVNQVHAMIWDGKPYIPVGGMVNLSYIREYDPTNPVANEENYNKDIAAMQQMLSKGLNDVYINAGVALNVPAWAWQYITDWMDENGVIYGVQLNGHYYAPNGYMDHQRTTAFAMRGNEEGTIYKTDNVTQSGTVSYTVHDYTSTLMNFGVTRIETAFVVIDNSTLEPVQFGYGTGSIGANYTVILSADVTLPKEGNYAVVFSPKLYIEGGLTTNMWDTPDFMADSLGTFLSEWEPGNNFRFFVDPVTNEEGYCNLFESMRYVSPNYSAMYAQWLKGKYSTVDELNTAWEITPAANSYLDAANIIPLYTTEKGSVAENISYGFNYETLEQYKFNIRNGVMWDDYLKFKSDVLLDFNNKIADAIKEKIDAPVIYKHTGLLHDYFINKNISGGFDGLGAESYGSYEALESHNGFAFSETEQADKTMWFIVTETNTDENMVRKHESGKWGYESKEYAHGHFQTLFDMGAKGMFDFLFYGDDYEELDAYTYPGKPEMYDWLKEFKDGLNVEQLKNTLTPVSPYYIYPSSQSWWTPPNKREGVLYNDDYTDYNSFVAGGRGHFKLQTNNPDVDTDVLFVTLENSPATKVWGPALSEMLQKGVDNKKIVFGGLRVDLGQLPEIDKYYTTEKSRLENGDKIQVLAPSPTSEVLAKTPDGKPWMLRDGNLYIIANENWRMLDNNASESEERTDVWIEAEDYVDISGVFEDTYQQNASGSHYLRAYSNTAVTSEANYNFEVSETDVYNIWALAANPNVIYSSSFSWRVNGESYAEVAQFWFNGFSDISYDATSHGWIKLGTKVLAEGEHTLSVMVDKRRDMDECMYQSFDCFAVVPANWNWKPGNAITRPEPAQNNVLWIESDEYTGKDGFFHVAPEAKGSGKQILVVNYYAESESTVTYSFSPNVSGNYVIYVLATPSYANNIASLKYKTDTMYDFTTGGGWGTKFAYNPTEWTLSYLPMMWNELGVFKLDKDKIFNLTLLADEFKEGRVCQVIDCLVAVPLNGRFKVSDVRPSPSSVVYDVLELDKATLEIEGINYNSVKHNLNLKTRTASGGFITWTSSDSSIVEIVNGNSAVVKRAPDGDKEVVLTAEIRPSLDGNPDGSVSLTKAFYVKVIKADDLVVSDYSVTYKDGSKIGDALMADSTINAKVNVTNNGEFETISLIMAFYDNQDRLLNVHIERNPLEKGVCLNYDAMFDVPDGAVKCKMMIWKDLESLSPIWEG